MVYSQQRRPSKQVAPPRKHPAGPWPPLCPGRRLGSREPEAAERPLTSGGGSDHLSVHIRMPFPRLTAWVHPVVGGSEFP